jgi:hypothetical protein
MNVDLTSPDNDLNPQRNLQLYIFLFYIFTDIIFLPVVFTQLNFSTCSDCLRWGARARGGHIELGLGHIWPGADRKNPLIIHQIPARPATTPA